MKDADNLFETVPEESVHSTLYELREMAYRQQNQIESQHQILIAKEQRLRYLKQYEARQQRVQIESEKLQRLRDRVESQELKLKKLRAIRGQVDYQKHNNIVLSTDLDTIRALFNEKEKELSLAVAKVDELTKQLEELKRGQTTKELCDKVPSSGYTIDMEKLRRELMYRNRLNNQQNYRLHQQREALSARQEEMCAIDKRISELQERLHRKRLLNEQMAKQISAASHKAAFNQLIRLTSSINSDQSDGYHIDKMNGFVLNRNNIATVEPYAVRTNLKGVLEDSTTMKYSNYGFDEKQFSISKSDPKYQTLPYNTKFPSNHLIMRTDPEVTTTTNYLVHTAHSSPLNIAHKNIATPLNTLELNKSDSDAFNQKPVSSVAPSTIYQTSSTRIQSVVDSDRLVKPALPPKPTVIPPPRQTAINTTDNSELDESTNGKTYKELAVKPKLLNIKKSRTCNSKSEDDNETDEEDSTQQLTNRKTNVLLIERRVSFDPLALLLDASLEGELELVRKTAAQVTNPSAANDEGITALHNAICAGHLEIVKFLVEFGCDVNAQDSDGWTPLHCAASCNNVAMVKFLVEHGACIFATTLSDHETAAEKCEEDEEGFDGCSEYLYSIQEKLGILSGGVLFAVFDYTAQQPDELSFKDGQQITVLRKGDENEREWWWSKLNSQEGYVPRNLLGLYPRVGKSQITE